MWDFDKSKSANLLKNLKGEHPTKKWQNCGTEVLCVMLYYDRDDLARIINKILGKTVFFCVVLLQTVLVIVLLKVW